MDRARWIPGRPLMWLDQVFLTLSLFGELNYFRVMAPGRSCHKSKLFLKKSQAITPILRIHSHREIHSLLSRRLARLSIHPAPRRPPLRAPAPPPPSAMRRFLYYSHSSRPASMGRRGDVAGVHGALARGRRVGGGTRRHVVCSGVRWAPAVAVNPAQHLTPPRRCLSSPSRTAALLLLSIPPIYFELSKPSNFALASSLSVLLTFHRRRSDTCAEQLHSRPWSRDRS